MSDLALVLVFGGLGIVLLLHWAWVATEELNDALRRQGRR